MQMFIFPFKICRPLAFFSYLILNIDRMKKYPNKKEENIVDLFDNQDYIKGNENIA